MSTSFALTVLSSGGGTSGLAVDRSLADASSLADVALFWNPVTMSADFAIEANDLAQDRGLHTAVLLSLFLDRRAEDGDVLPDGETDRRGWWADAYAAVEGDKIGSRLWLLGRSKDTADVLARAEDYGRESLAWMVEDKVAASVSVASERLPAPLHGWSLLIQIERPGQDVVRYRYDRTWTAEEKRT